MSELSVPWEYINGTDEPTGIPNDPSPEGYELGREMARLTGDADEVGCCHDCAFRLGTRPNGSVATLMNALKCVMEGEPFYCHVEKGLCKGYVAGRAALAQREGAMKREAMKREWSKDNIMPGFIVADTAIQFGSPTIEGTRIPAETMAGMFLGGDSIDLIARAYDQPRERVIAAIAFDLGRDWQKSRKRRKALEEACDAMWRTLPLAARGAEEER